MSTRGAKKRGRPPKVQVSERGKKFQYHLLKKPKYLQNFNKGSDSQSSTPTTSRPCSPQESVIGKRGSRTRGKNGHKSTRKGGMAGSAYPRRGYNPNADYHDSEYHYGSDFGDDSSEKSDAEDDVGFSDSESNPSVDDGDRSSDSDFSLSSYSTLSGTPRKAIARPPSPEPLWLQNRELPPLILPKSSDDLLVPREYIMPVISIYEVLRHFRNLVRLSPFRIEDFCAALVCDDQSSLLTEIHIMLLKALIREEDAQQTHFGPLDQKDSVNISIYLIDNLTYPEVLRAYVESDKNFDADVLDVLNTTDYPFTTLEGRVKVLKFLTDQFLITNPVREDLLSEVPMHYDDHCRVCHKLGDLLCCETCPAVYHLECVDPPLTKIPDDDWQCGICRSHRVSGVVDCILDIEKQGQLCRQECLGFDRLGRKYYFLCRRIFVENDESEISYYTTSVQFEQLLKVLDPNEMEATLCRELLDYKEEVVRQMDLTEKLTCQFKGNKKSYLEVENAAILQANKELEEKQEEERREKERLASETVETCIQQDSSLSVSSIDLPHEVEVVHNVEVQSTDISDDLKSVSSITEKLMSTTSITNHNRSIVNAHSDSKIEDLLETDGDVIDAEKRKDKDARLKIGPFTGRSSGVDSSRMTRLKSSQLANGTYLYKLGLENQFKSYVNQYATNPIALNKPQRNEERDKKRHLSHKFSLTSASEFKWIGGMNGSRNLLLNTFKQTLLQLEQSLQAPYMHPNWPLIKKHWLAAVGACQQPKDYARTVIVLQSCIKGVVFANVWHEHLGHIKLLRMTANEREERKKHEKREKKEREEEEERNRTIISGYVKYTMGFKHQLWKQKGEEYRIHGRWGWIWFSSSRNVKHDSCYHLSLSAGPQLYMVQVRDSFGLKTLGVNSCIYSYIHNNFQIDDGSVIEVKAEEQNEDIQDEATKNLPGNLPLKNVRVVPLLSNLEEIDVSKGLTNPGRLLFPKVARKSQLDDFLARRIHLKLLEEKKISHKLPADDTQNEDDVDVVNDDLDVTDSESGIERQLNSMISGKVPLPGNQHHTQVNRELLNTITKKIQILRLHYTSISKLAKDYQCYSKGCNINTSSLSTNCYSPFCLQRNKVRRELLALLRKANFHTNAQSTLKLPNILGVAIKKPPVTPIKKAREQVNLDEATISRELANALKLAPLCKEESDPAYLKSKTILPPVSDIKEEIKCEVNKEDTKMDIDKVELNPSKVQEAVKCNSEMEYEDVDMENMSPDTIKEMIVGNAKIKTCDVTESVSAADGIRKETLDSSSTAVTSVRSNNALNGKFPVYSAPQNRRFCAYRSSVKRDDNVIKTERAEDGSERVYSVVSSSGKVYLKRLPYSISEKRKKKQSIKYPISATFQNRRGIKSVLMLHPNDLRKLGRSGGRIYVNGFHHLAKPNNIAWPYPCSRPLFKTCWLYRTVNVRSFSGIALQLRIMWSCLRWDDMQAKAPNSDGKHQITTETEILSLELLKHRYIGPYLERAQYLRRKVVIPLELPKTIREVTSIRSGLRKRKRPESPQCTDPQVTEEWIDEDKLELWEIKQYGERLEKANVQVITRSRTGNLPPSRTISDLSPADSPNKTAVTNKATPEEIKEKMEQQLRLQRAAHQQKRALELKSPQGQVIKMVGNTAQVSTTDGHMKILKNIVMPASASGKSTLTSLLTANTQGATNKFAGRRIYMTKGADGTARLITGPANILPKNSTVQQSLIKGPQNVTLAAPPPVTTVTSTPTKSSTIPQRVQIMRSPDGNLTIKGLMPGQQVVQMPDGMFQVLSSTQIQSIATSTTTTPKSTLNTSVKAIIKTPPSITTLAGKLILQNNQIKAIPQVQHSQTPTKNHSIIVKPGQTPVLQKIGTPTTAVVTSGTQMSQQQDSSTGQQVIATSVQQIVANQIIVNNPTLAQHLATGKLQVASVNGQQVLIRPTGNGQAQVVAQITTGNVSHAQLQNQNITQTVGARQITQPQVATEQTVQTKTNQEHVNQMDATSMEHLLVGQPPGTVIKCVTAQVIQTQQGPRIVLQGLQGAEFTQQQLTAVQHQVKQQLLKAQASTGKQGVLGPTKIYLAVQPSGAETITAPNSQPPPLAPVQQVITSTSLPTSVQETKIQQTSSPMQTSFANAVQTTVSTPCPAPNSQQVCSISSAKPKPKVVVQPANQVNENAGATSRQVVVNGQQSSELLQAMKANMEANRTTTAPPSSIDPKDTNREFVVTPDYIQQTIKTALKQENLNPDIEEKLLQLQRYQETKMKQEPEPPPITPRPIVVNNLSQTPISNVRVPSRKRPSSTKDDDAEWVMDTPKRSRIVKPVESVKKEEPIPIPHDNKVAVPPRARVKLKESPEDEKRVAQKTKIMVAVFRQKEALKKEILRKRALLERELQCEIQKEVAEELAARTRLERTRQEEVRSSANRRKSTSSSQAPSQPATTPPSVTTSNTPTTTPSSCSSRSSGRGKRHPKQPSTPSSNPSKNKKEKIYCVCRTPYDETKFYVGCDLCNNWFHGECVGITEQSSKTMTEFICSECKHARDTQEIFCLCKQPYDESQFYICCDSCQDWFHGRCVGILQSEAENIDEYVCPNCQTNSSVNYANMKNLSDRDFEGLRKLMKQIQSHKSAWPFMEPVDPTEAPDYYKVIKEPMDLQKIENKINEKKYNKLSEFIGDMTKIFDNCRYYNPKESPFFKCAESLEAYFVNKIQFLREKLSENNKQ